MYIIYSGSSNHTAVECTTKGTKTSKDSGCFQKISEYLVTEKILSFFLQNKTKSKMMWNMLLNINREYIKYSKRKFRFIFINVQTIMIKLYFIYE